MEYGGGYVDEIRAPSDQPLTRATDLDLNTTLHFGKDGGGLFLPLTGHFDQLDYANGVTQTDASLRERSAARFLIANSFNYTATTNPGFASSSSLLGAFDLASFAARTQYRATIAYTLLPHVDIAAAGVEVDRVLDDRTGLKSGLQYDVAGHETFLDFSAQCRFDHFSLSFDGQAGVPHRNFSFVMRLSFSFGLKPAHR